MNLHKNALQRRRRAANRKRYNRVTRKTLAKIAEAIRQGESAEAVILAVDHSCDSPDHELTGRPRLLEVMREIAGLVDDGSVPAATRLGFTQSLVHAAAVGEWSKSREENESASKRAEATCVRDIFDADPAKATAEIRELIRRGRITLDEIDPPPAG